MAGGWGVRLISVRHNLSIIPPTGHNFKHNTLVSWVTPEGIILYFSSITSLRIPYISTVFGSFILFRNKK